MREARRLLVALHRPFFELSGIDGMEAGGFMPGAWQSAVALEENILTIMHKYLT